MDNNSGLLKCFKYCTGKSALRSLKDGTLHFSSPSTLNDVLESSFSFHDTETNIKIAEQTLSEVLMARGMSSEWKFDRGLFAELAAINEEENRNFKQACDRAGIFSATRRPNNQAMWAYYADNYRGFCFEFQWTKEAFEKFYFYPAKVSYTDSPRVFNRFEDWSTAFKELASTNHDLSIQQLMDISLEEPFRRRWGIRATARALSIKHTDWKHEDEVRLIAGKAQAVPILKDVLKSVHYVRTDFPEWVDVIGTLRLHYPSVEIVHGEFNSESPSGVYAVRQFKLIPVVDDADKTLRES